MKTLNRTQNRILPRYFSIHSLRLGLGIEVPRYNRLKGRKCQYIWLFEGKKGESDSIFQDSLFRTWNRSPNRNRHITMQGLALRIELGILTYIAEFPESLVSDSKSRDSRLKTRNRTRIRPRYFSIQSLGLRIGIEVPRHSRLKGRKCHYLWLFEGKKAQLDSKFRDSRFRTRNRSRNRNRFFTMQCLGLGIGLGILTYKVSDSESGLENRDSGNSAVTSTKLTKSRCPKSKDKNTRQKYFQPCDVIKSAKLAYQKFSIRKLILK